MNLKFVKIRSRRTLTGLSVNGQDIVTLSRIFWESIGEPQTYSWLQDTDTKDYYILFNSNLEDSRKIRVQGKARSVIMGIARGLFTKGRYALDKVEEVSIPGFKKKETIYKVRRME